MDRGAVMQRVSMFVVGSLLGLFCMAPMGEAGAGDWLILPEEAAMAPAPEPGPGILEAGREDIGAGPVIEGVEPLNGGRLPMPIQVLVRFATRSEPVDLASLKVILINFISIDITDRIRPYATPEGIQVPEAKIPPGKSIAYASRSPIERENGV